MEYSNYWKWSCQASSSKNRSLALETVTKHPLEKFINKTNKTEKNQVNASNNIKCASLLLDGDDPLSVLQRQNYQDDSEDTNDTNYTERLTLWDNEQEKVFSKFTPCDVVTNIHFDQYNDYKRESKNDNTFHSTVVFPSTDCIKQIQSANKLVLEAWNERDRVGSLRIIIQCLKLLSESHTPTFYPVKFFHIMKILDSFDELLYKRFITGCTKDLYDDAEKPKYSNNVTPDVIPEEIKETSKNWMYKVATIRELVPRYYTEVAIMRIYYFMPDRKIEAILERLIWTIRGISNPLVNVYARCYLSRIGITLPILSDFSFLKTNFYDYLLTYPRIFNRNMHLKSRKEYSEYINSFLPALVIIFKCILQKFPPSIQDDLFETCLESSNNSLLLYAMLNSFKNDFVLKNCMKIMTWISEVNPHGVPAYQLMEAFGAYFSDVESCSMDSIASTKILERVWTFISTIGNPSHYLSCVEIWMPISVIYFEKNQINLIFGDIVRHLGHQRSKDQYCQQLELIIKNIVENIPDLIIILQYDELLQILSLFSISLTKVSICKYLLDSFIKKSADRIENDAVVINNLLIIAQILHDSINFFTVSDEKRQISLLICTFIRRVDFGYKVDLQLSFYSKSRGLFYNLEDVHKCLVECVNMLCMKTLRDRLRNNKDISDVKACGFSRACVAFCFITVPSFDCLLSKWRLYVLTGQIALANRCFAQAVACFEAVIELIPECLSNISNSKNGNNTENIIKENVFELLSILLIVPDNLSYDSSLHLFRKFLQTIENSMADDVPLKTCVHIQTLYFLKSAAQEKYPYHACEVEANDTLYNQNEEFIYEINQLCGAILDKCLNQLKAIGSSGELAIQAEYSFALSNCIMLCTEINDASIVKLIVNLWNLARKNQYPDDNTAANTILHLRNRYCNGDNAEIYDRILSKLH